MAEDEHDRIYRQNEDQYKKIHDNSHRIANLEAEMRALKSDLIGVTGRNGLRGEFRTYQKRTDEQMKLVMQSLDDVQSKLSAWVKWTVGTVIAASGVIVAVMQLVGG